MYFQNKTLAALTTLFVVGINGSYTSSFDGKQIDVRGRDLETCEECSVESKVGETISCIYSLGGTEYTFSCDNFATFTPGSGCTNAQFPGAGLSFWKIEDGKAFYEGSHNVPGYGFMDLVEYEVTFDPTIEEGVCEAPLGLTVSVSVGCSCLPSDSPSSVSSNLPSMMPSMMQSNNDVDENSSDDEGSDDNVDDDHEFDVGNENECCCCDEKDIQKTLFSKIKEAFKNN